MTTPDERSSDSRATVSLTGILCISVGAMMLFLRRDVEELLGARWTVAWTVAWLVVSALFLLWGLDATLQRVRLPGRFARSSKMLRIAVPRPGLVYLVMMVVMLTGSLLGRSNMLMLVFALMAGPFVLNGWITFSMLRRIRVVRQVPAAVMAGELASVSVTLENRKLLVSIWGMTVRDEVANDRERLEPEVLFVRVPRRGVRHALYDIRLMQRGRYRFGPLHVFTRFPLGLVERGLNVPSNAEVLVYPRLGRLSPQWKRDHLLAAELAHHQQLKKGVFDDEFHGIREFRSGDNPKAIHWRTSARQTQLMVREFHQSRDRNLLVLLDLWLPPEPRAEDDLRIELAVSFAATLCIEQMKLSRDSRLEMGVAGAAFERWEGRSGPASIDSLLRMLAVVKGAKSTRWAELRSLAANRPASSVRTLLLTTRTNWHADAEFREAWVRGEAGQSLHDLKVVIIDQKVLSGVFQLDP